MKTFAEYRGRPDNILTPQRVYLIHLSGIDEELEALQVGINHGMWVNYYEDYNHFKEEWELL